ncbi:MAG TPA: PhzF family phenazine biosynthesis protein [Acidimicrobiales bacterium]|nr:PhzF family phenazine biosynthesis protein [Acidimicrobiales bacterium]
MVDRLTYHLVDVFTAVPFAGNPLAVVLGAGGLDDRQLLALTREFNLSETAFPLPPDRHGADYRLRIFMPGGELAFAGHPSVGAAFVMASTGRVSGPRPGASATIRQSCGAGVLPIVVSADEHGALHRIELTAGEPEASAPTDAAPLLGALGLSPADLAPGRAARVCASGVAQCFLPVVDGAVSRIAPRVGDLARLAAASGWQAVSVFSYDEQRRVAHARVLADGIAWAEDPATGSAAASMGAWLAAEGIVPSEGTNGWRVEQGEEMGRPSVLECSVTVEDGRATVCRVAGRVAPVATGEIAVPAR